ncbi:MAG: diguanylate cyclase [Candidatus Lindowbacteria bacterium]|nr:diguanylate cyclase [Candidatus Lindowbacteria bacterium]
MKKIMVVDDEDDIRRLLRKRLNAAKYEVVDFASAVDAIEAIDKEDPDLVLMDINMPEMDGFEACKKITSAHPEIPVLFLSARADVDDKLIGFEAGGRDYLSKPFSPAELIARVKATIREKEAKEAVQKKADNFEVLAITDALTGVANRRYFDERFKEELKRAIRYGFDISAAMLDIDNFKLVNDTYGHAIGDEVIIEVVNCMKLNVRAVDLIARYGGEEFVILLPQTDLSESIGTAERIRAAVENLKLGEGRPEKVTASIGVATAAVDKLIVNADAALYDAKRGGRNRVCKWQG